MISKHATRALARQVLGTNKDVSTIIDSLLRYKNVPSLCEMYAELLQAQKEEADEKIQVEYDNLEEVDDALLVVVAEREQEASSDSMVEDENSLDWLDGVGATSDEWLDSIKVGCYGKPFKAPDSSDEWARVKRHLRLQQLCQKFHKNHLADGQLQAELFYEDDKMNLKPELSKVLTAEFKIGRAHV